MWFYKKILKIPWLKNVSNEYVLRKRGTTMIHIRRIMTR